MFRRRMTASLQSKRPDRWSGRKTLLFIILASGFLWVVVIILAFAL
jgi:hypothetical protein